MSISKVAFVWVIFISSAGCDEGSLPDITWEGNKIRFGTTYDYLPCGTTLEVLDQAVVELENSAEISLQKDEKITYYWLRPSDMHLTPCGNADGCTNGSTTVYSELPLATHELAHTVFSKLGRSHALLEEGFAVAFDWFHIPPSYPCTDDDFPCEDAIDHIESALSSEFGRKDLNYLFAGHFIRYLLDTHGLSACKQVYTEISLNSNYSKINSIFLTVFGDDISQLLQNWKNEAPWCYNAEFVCNYPEIVPNQDGSDLFWELAVDLRCDSQTVNGQDGYRFLHYYSVISIPGSGEYVFTVESTPDTSAELYIFDCNNCPGIDMGPEISMNGQTVLSLEESTYWLLIREYGNVLEIDSSIAISITPQ